MHLCWPDPAHNSHLGSSVPANLLSFPGAFMLPGNLPPMCRIPEGGDKTHKKSTLPKSLTFIWISTFCKNNQGFWELSIIFFFFLTLFWKATLLCERKHPLPGSLLENMPVVWSAEMCVWREAFASRAHVVLERLTKRVCSKRVGWGSGTRVTFLLRMEAQWFLFVLYWYLFAGPKSIPISLTWITTKKIKSLIYCWFLNCKHYSRNNQLTLFREQRWC